MANDILSLNSISEKKIFIIRHADKEAGVFFNEKLNTQDPPLSNLGIKQAKLISKRLKKQAVQEIWSSDLLRTRQTTQILNKYLHKPIVFLSELREINMGAYEKLNQEDFLAKYPAYSKPYYLEENDVPYPEGESGSDVLKRVWPIMEKITASNLQNIVLITHGGIIRTIISHILNMEMGKRYHLGNPPELCSISLIIYEPEYQRFVLQTFNDYSHIRGF